MWLFVIFLVVPLIEIALFIKVGGLIGLWPTLAIVILTAILGTWMIRMQGVMALNQLRASLNELRDPTEPLAHGAMILIAGALLLTPGFFTDAIGFALLFPPIRSAVYAYLRSRAKVETFTVHETREYRPDIDETIIDVEYREVSSRKDRDSGWTKH